jgi:hypothetical protein
MNDSVPAHLKLTGRRTTITWNQVTIVTLFDPFDSIVAALRFQVTGPGTTVAVNGITVVTALANRRLPRTIAADLKDTDRRAPIPGGVVAVVALFRPFDCAVATEGFGATGIAAAVSASSISIIALLSNVDDAVTADFKGAVRPATIVIQLVSVVALLKAFQQVVAAHGGLDEAG